jgi:processive 1,2-diacylglycerol beta-glucosyltransferase
MKRVLVLTASYGSGHNAAARCLAAAFDREGCAVTVVDHFRELVSPIFDRASRALYYAILRRARVLWGVGYALGDWMPSDSPLAFGLTRLGAERLASLLETLAPDAVVTVHATPAAAMSSLVGRGRRVPFHTTVVTDFVAHSQWIARHIDCYCVAADEVKHEFIARGIPAERIVVTGVPVRPEFAEPADPAGARAALGLSTSLPVVLAMAGSHGALGRLPDVARALGALGRPLQGLLVTGRDEGLRTKLDRLTAGTRVHTRGHVDDVRQLMAAADLLVTKAGGLTLAEAMAAELPVLAYGSLPGQERRNERFAARAGIALVARTYHDLVRLLDQALGDPELLERLRARTRRIRRPDATQRIVGVVLERADMIHRGNPG